MKIWSKTKDPRIKKRDGVYWARFMRRGRRVEKSLETKNFELAQKKCDELSDKVIAGKSWKQERQLFADAWIEFLKDKTDGNKVRAGRQKTLHEYAGFGDRYYIPFFGEMRLCDIDETTWRDFVEHVRHTHGKIKFFNIVKYWHGFLTWAEAHGKMPPPRMYVFNPDEKEERESEDFIAGKVFTPKELKAMRDSAAKRGARVYLFMLMTQYMAFRPPKEIAHLKKDRIDLAGDVVNLRKIDTKTNKARAVPIHPIVKPLLIEQMHLSGDSEYLFPNAHIHMKPDEPMDRGGFRNQWAKILEECGIAGRVYDFRHTYITYAIKSGMNPVVVAQITGTSLRIIMKHYLHLSPADYAAEVRKYVL